MKNKNCPRCTAQNIEYVNIGCSNVRDELLSEKGELIFKMVWLSITCIPQNSWKSIMVLKS